jgi:hypothetical protein
MAEAAAKLVSGDEEVTKNKRPSAKTFAFTLLAAGATLAVIQQLLGRRHASTTSTDGSGAEGQSVPEQAAATVTELTDAAADQAPAVTDAAADQAAAVTDAAAEKVSELSDTTANKTKKTAAKATTPRKRTARTTTKASRSTAAGETPSGGAG